MHARHRSEAHRSGSRSRRRVDPVERANHAPRHRTTRRARPRYRRSRWSWRICAGCASGCAAKHSRPSSATCSRKPWPAMWPPRKPNWPSNRPRLQRPASRRCHAQPRCVPVVRPLPDHLPRIEHRHEPDACTCATLWHGSGQDRRGHQRTVGRRAGALLRASSHPPAVCLPCLRDGAVRRRFRRP